VTTEPWRRELARSDLSQAGPDRRPAGTRVLARWIDRDLVAIGRSVRFKKILAYPHGHVFGKPEYGNFVKYGLRTPDKRIPRRAGCVRCSDPRVADAVLALRVQVIKPTVKTVDRRCRQLLKCY
jgi:hypothetical protein